jgi:hypothetical protein
VASDYREQVLDARVRLAMMHQQALERCHALDASYAAVTQQLLANERRA